MSAMNHPGHVLYDLRLFLTTEYPCSYLPEQRARNLVADPVMISSALYGQLAPLGFRRSGDHLYRPHCQACQACRSLRIPAARFQPNRAQRRIWARNQDLTMRQRDAHFDDEHFALFARYIATRHGGGGMDPASPESYWSFITSQWCPTTLCEFHLGSRLLAVAVVDRLSDGLSAVYTFFDPDCAPRSLGTFAILWQIAEAQRQALDWVYLGYWIAQCDKMAYKSRFHPHEIFIAERFAWVEPRTP